MSGQQETAKKLDTALISLVTAVKMLGFPADLEQLRRAYVFDDKGMDTITLVRAAKNLGLKASMVSQPQTDLHKLPFPSIAILNNGNHVVLGRVQGDKLMVIDPYCSQPLAVPIDTFRQAWSGQLVFIARRFSLKETEKKFGLSWFMPVIWRYKKFFTQVLFISLLLQLIGLMSPLFTQVIIDKVLVHRSVNTLDVFVGGMLAVGIFQIWFTAVRSYLFTHTTNKVDVALSTKVFRHVTTLPMKYFESWQVGDIISRIHEVENIQRFITGASLTVVLDAVFAVVYLAVMFWYSGTLSLVVLTILPLFVLLSLIVTPIFKKLLNERFLIGAENQSFLIESITGIQTVKSIAMEKTVIQKWEDMLARYVKTALSTTNVGNIAGNIAGFFQQCFNLSILWVGAQTVIDGKMSVGELIAFQMLAGQVIAPLLRLINMWQQMQQTMVSINRVGDILNEGVEPEFDPSRTTLPKIKGDIVLDRATFRYRADMREVLHQVSLHIRPGMKVGIVGRSGSGKSTLTKLLQRLYVPESGRVLIDGVDLAQVEPAWLRRQIGVVLQENFLFGGTVQENIAIAWPQAQLEDVVRVAKLAGAHEFIAELPKGYDTHVGERGTALSGGQRQRIAIARALLTNPSIVIFDEATSALDYESERIIMDNLQAISEGRTMVMIAHRLSTVRRSDLIVVMEKGQIAEAGTHEELLALGGYYYSLYQQQELIGQASAS